MPNINIDDAYILGETGAQVDKVTGLFTKDEDTTSGEKAFAQLNIGAAGSNRNLLINPFFTVNQIGFTSGSATQTYVADLWFIHSNNGAGTITNTGKGLQCATTNTIIRSHQTQDYFLAELGKTFTFSVKFGGSVYPFTFTLPETAPSGSTVLVGTAIAGVLYAAITWQPQNNRVAYEVRVDSNGLFEAVKLELGSVSTLANDTPPDYGTELIKCRGHFERIHSLGSSEIVGMGIGVSASSVRIGIPSLICHTIQSVTYSGGGLLLEGGGNYRTLTSIGKLNATPKNGFLTVTCGSSDAITLYQTYALVGTAAGGYIDINAYL